MAERPLSRNGHNGHYGLTIYGHGYGQVGCLFKDMEKYRSPVDYLWKKLEVQPPMEAMNQQFFSSPPSYLGGSCTERSLSSKYNYNNNSRLLE